MPGYRALNLRAHRFTQASRGYVIAAAESIQKAIACIHELDFDLVLLGRRLSLGDQERLTFLLRSSGCRVPVISITSSSDQSDISSDASIENNPETLLRCIAEALAEIAVEPESCTSSTVLVNESDPL